MTARLQIDDEAIADFCRKWRVKEFAIFGSALREDFGRESDVDVLVDFEQDAPWDAFQWVDMIEELTEIFEREVHLVEKPAIRNPFRRKRILGDREVIYSA